MGGRSGSMQSISPFYCYSPDRGTVRVKGVYMVHFVFGPTFMASQYTPSCFTAVLKVSNSTGLEM